MDRDYSKDFGKFEGRTWLNCSHQGPLPRESVEELCEALSWKISPHHLTSNRFVEIPERLKNALGKLICAPPAEIILGNSASYGLHLLANGIRWRAGDEVLLVKGDFPSDILPWLALEERGVRVKLIETRGRALQADELSAHLSGQTKLLCLTWVHSFTGEAVDIRALGDVCRDNGVLFILNCSQALGARPLDVSVVPVDAVTSVGFKWLCGPYGTGFCWMRTELRESLNYNQAYWLAMQSADDLTDETEVRLKQNLGARKYDVFGTANFFNFKPWAASVEYLLRQGIRRIEKHNGALVARLIAGLDREKYQLLSPEPGPTSTALVLISHKSRLRNREIFEQLKRERIDIALRGGNLRISPHLYNRRDDIDRTLRLLSSV